MRPDRDRVFTREGAALGVATVVLAVLAVTAVGALLAFVMLLVF